ncbi:MAG TPA: hypothetical protein VKE94_10990 [Gemmataceae bacterium]|nr:hypothetical protein [Gemmataceae bacterium]
MDDRHDPDADYVVRARTWIARAAKGVEALEEVAGQAFCRLTALTGMLARLEELARSRDPEAVEAAMLDAATVRREAMVLLCYLDSHQWNPARAAANGRNRARPRAALPNRAAIRSVFS